LQDIAFDPNTGRIYSYLPQVGKVAYFDPATGIPTLICMPNANPRAKELSGLFFGMDGILYILTIDGKYYAGNVITGMVSPITQTTLPLLNNNLRGDMASCVPALAGRISRSALSKTSSIEAFPNPIRQNMLLLKIKPEKASRGSEIVITDSKGFVVLKKKADLIDGMNQLRVDISNLPKGLYILSTVDAQHNSTQTKFMRE
jgi:hypothetical protein